VPLSLLVYLVPIDGGRFELDSEPFDDHAPAPGPPDGAWRARFRAMEGRWHAAVHAAQHHASAGRFGRLRDRAIRSAAETIDEQRTLWRLRQAAEATLVYPAPLDQVSALDTSRRLLAHARRHHAWWLAIDGVVFAASGLFALVPGPNLIAYYFAMRFAGHFLSWRGAQRGLGALRWSARPARPGDDPRVILAHPAPDTNVT
jgi:hypothetical protein